MPHDLRAASSGRTSESGWAGLRGAMPRGTAREAPLGAGRTFSSVSVFHAPQLGHLPSHRGVSAPQSVQKNTLFDFLAFAIFVLVAVAMPRWTHAGHGD
ncbi:MAG: hypothetical protein SangKO_079180 [Sandaracinaceae bacterium]